MASAAFKSTTKRTPIGNTDDSGSKSKTGSSHRRSRSLSRFSHSADATTTPRRSGKFVNTGRGSEFSDISLDDLAIEFFESANRGRDGSDDVIRGSGAGERRGRSVTRGWDGKGSGSGGSNGGKVAPPERGNSRRRRSVSSVRYQMSDSESEVESSRKPTIQGNNTRRFSVGSAQMSSLQNSVNSGRRPLGRSMSQKDLSKFHDGYSSQSSALTDDDLRDVGVKDNGSERTIRAVYSQRKMDHPVGDDVNNGIYDTMRKELRYAVEEIRMELEQAAVNKNVTNNSDGLESVSSMRNNYVNKLEQSEKRKHDLLSEILLEDQRSSELSKLVKELLLDPKNSTDAKKPLRSRKRSNDRNRASKQLTQEAEKYFEDFISNIEDTDMSSFDGERSDSSSTIGGINRSRDHVMYSAGNESFRSPAKSNAPPVDMDGIALPWLQWETSNDASPLLSSNKDVNAASNYSVSSRGSWSPGVVNGPRENIAEILLTKYGVPVNDQSQSCTNTNKPRFDFDKYFDLQKKEDLHFERWRQQQRISSGGLLLCTPSIL